jgi:hypothetical protein
MRYLRSLSVGRLVLWCYFLWYLVVLVRYFETNTRLWLTSLGIAGIVGIALYINSTTAGTGKQRPGFWPTIRIFLIPFCVASYSALVKDRRFYLGIFSPEPVELGLAVGFCAALCGAWLLAKNTER